MPFSQRQHEGADIKVALFGAFPPTDVNGTMPLHFENCDPKAWRYCPTAKQSEIADRVSKLENKRAAEQPVVQDSAQDLSQDNVVQDGGAEADGVRQM